MSARDLPVERRPLATLRAQLREGGYGYLVDRAEEIRAAAARGCLLWTHRRLTTTDYSRIDARPWVRP